MLASRNSSNYCPSRTLKNPATASTQPFSLKRTLEKQGENYNSIVLTLNDDISNQLLESKKEGNHTTDSTSVELWIKSLKDMGDLTDDSRSDHDNNDSCSDSQDDLQLGAEATSLFLKKIQECKRSAGSASDSDDSKCSPRRARCIFSINSVSSQPSLDSDTSALSSVTSVSSLLTARESDPEEVLKGLGFAGPSILDNIPDRFLAAGTRCHGIDTGQYIEKISKAYHKDSMNSCESCDLPPWVMVRVNDIPKTFLRSSNITCLHSPESSKPCLVPLIKEPSLNPDGINKEPGIFNLARPPKSLPFTSKFGTFLEPVSEEVEMSSQGSGNHSPATIKNLSFESNRSSTLKSNSYDEPGTENIMKIPSLKDLWQSQQSETDKFSPRDGPGSFEILTDNVVEYTPGLNTVGQMDEDEKWEEALSSEVYMATDDIRGSRDEVYGSTDEVYGYRDDVYGSRDEVYGSRGEVYGSRGEVYGSRGEVYGAKDEIYKSSHQVYRSIVQVHVAKDGTQGPDHVCRAVDEGQTSANESLPTDDGVQWSEKKDQLIPTVLDYLANEEMPISEDDPVSSDDEQEKTNPIESVSNHSSIVGVETVYQVVKDNLCTDKTSQEAKKPVSLETGGIKNTSVVVKINSPDQSESEDINENVCTTTETLQAVTNSASSQTGAIKNTLPVDEITSPGQSQAKNVKENVGTSGKTSQATKKFLTHQTGNIEDTLPVIKINSPGKHRKISTVESPDYTKLLPVVSKVSTDPHESNTHRDLTCSESKTIGTQPSGCKVGLKKSLQLNLSDKWTVTEKNIQPQIYISNNKQPKTSNLQNCKVKGNKVTVAKRTHFPSQIIFPQIPSRTIECFVNVEVVCTSNEKALERAPSAAASVCWSEDSSGFISMATQSTHSAPEDDGNCKTRFNNVVHQKELANDEGGEIDMQKWCESNGKELSFSYREDHAKECSVNFCSNVARRDSCEMFKDEMSIEEGLDGLQRSLKGVKLYKAGIQLMQLASSIDSFANLEPQPITRAIKSSQVLLGSIQNEVNHLEEHILQLQTQLTEYKEQRITNSGNRLGNKTEFSSITRQLLREQLKMFHSMSSSMSSSPSTPNSYDETLPVFRENSALANDIGILRKEIQLLRRENDSRHSLDKKEILSEVRTEIKNCFSEFLQIMKSKT